MPDNPRVDQLLEDLLDSGGSPEEACRTCPELLPEVRVGWQRLCALKAGVNALFHEFPFSSGDMPSPLATADLPRIRGYEMREVLGRGGMGIVYKAWHLRLHRPVAVKMLLAGAYAQPQELERFLREAETVAGLRHANIVQVHEAGDVDGRPYFTMEFVEGGSLAQKLAGTPQPACQAAALVATVAEAVQAAHQRGVVHRDLKPGNILLTADGTPKVTDFGLARRLEGGGGLTQTGVPMGTPSYMAPEQARGNGDVIGPAADTYALGAILYECLTGRPPFRAETAAATVQQVLAEDPVPPSRLNPRVPRDLETICLKCLRKEPEKRYASAHELGEDLYRFLEGKPVRARPLGVAERVVKWARRRPTAAALLAALLVMSAAAVATGLWLRQREADRGEAQAQRQGQAREAIKTALSRADDLRGKERWQEALIILADASTHLADAGSPPLEERLEQARSDMRIAIDLERVRESTPLDANGEIDYRQQAAEYQEVFERAGLRTGDDTESVVAHLRGSAIRDQLLAAIDYLAFLALMVNDRAQVERLLRIAQSADPEPRWGDRFHAPAAWRSRAELLQLADDAFKSSPPPPGRQLALLGILLRQRVGAVRQSTRLLSEACRRLPNDFWLNRELGAALLDERRYWESIGYYRTALALRPDDDACYVALGGALLHAGQTDDAFAAFRRAVELSPTSASPRLHLMRALANVGRWKEAEAECNRALEIDPTSHLPFQQLATVLRYHQRLEDAAVLFRKALEINPNGVILNLYLGECLVTMARHEEAVTVFRKVVELEPAYLSPCLQLARELAAVGRRPEAIVVLQTAAARMPTYPELLLDLGKLLRAEGQSEEAVKVLQKAATLYTGPIPGQGGPVPLPREPGSTLPGGGPPLIQAVDGLAAALLDQGRFAEARAAIQRLLDLDGTEAGRRARRRQLDLCDTLLAIDARLPALLAGKEQPTEVTTQRALAEWCLKHKRLTATAARFYTAALSSQPSLGDDLEACHRLHAACAAVLAGCGVGKDAARLDDRQRAVLRRQALAWLTAEYDAWAERHRRGQPEDRRAAATALRSWEGNEDLAGVRGEQALAQLPADERRDWEALWAKVATVAAREPDALFQAARAHSALREWKKAAECYAQGFELDPRDDGDLWFEYAAVQLLAGERAGYRRTCEQMLVRCQTVSRMRPYLAARACTLAPGSTEDPAALGRLHLDELAGDANAFWLRTEAAALCVRTGQRERAIMLLEQSLAADGRPGRAVLTWLWLALAYQQMGRAEEARRWLDKAAGWLDQQEGRMPRLETIVLGLHPHNWLEAHVLRREAEALIRPANSR